MNEEEKDLINLKIAISPEKYIRELLQENQQLKEDYNKVVHEVTEFESKVYELEEVINKAIHRIQLLQMDGEVTIRDLGLIVRDLKGENK